MAGPHRNIRLQSDTLPGHLLQSIPDRFLDLLEIATYVYTADHAIRRGGDDVENVGENWRRRLHFRIPVRDPSFWDATETKDVLESTLGFLSEDDYRFEFSQIHNASLPQVYFPFTASDSVPPRSIEEVVMFSGGLDSLGGAIQELIRDSRSVAFVTHKPTDKLERRRRKLSEMLNKRARSKHPPTFVPVNIRKKAALSREHTQRSRSFLYATLGSIVAHGFGLSRLRFYENGVLSFNLPLSPQVVGARATRTTHPRVLAGFSQLFSLVANRKFVVENPFQWHTKTEVLEVIKQGSCADLVKYASSCTHTREMTKLHTHCGVCSQCVDRRFAVLAAGLETDDPQEAYKVDLLVGAREDGEPKATIAAYVEMATKVSRMNACDFFASFGETSRLIRHLEGSTNSNAMAVFELCQRHAHQVVKVIQQGIADYSAAFVDRSLPESCLLRMVTGSSQNGRPSTTSHAENSRTFADYAFCRTGRSWSVRFAGGPEFTLLAPKGPAYLARLLSRPGNPISVFELAATVAKQVAVPSGDAGATLDDETLAIFHAQIAEIRRRIDSLKDTGDPAERVELEDELEWYEKQLRKDTGLRGKARNAKDDRERVRKAVQVAIGRTIKRIAIDDPRFADHLKSPTLRCGWQPCYNPAEPVEWVTDF